MANVSHEDWSIPGQPGGAISRRDLLRRGALIGGALAAASGLLQLVGCSPSASAPAAAAPTQAAPAVSTQAAPAAPTQAAPAAPTQAAAAAPTVAPAAAATKLQGPVNWLSWATYQLPDILKGFSTTTGADVNPVSFGDNSESYLKIKATGGSQYDTSLIDGFWPKKMYDEKLIEAFDESEVPNVKQISAAFRKYPSFQAEGGKLTGFPNAWQPESLVYRKSKIPTVGSWDELWNPKYKGRVIQVDAANNTIATVAVHLGIKDPFKMTKDQLDTVKKKLMELKPNIKTFVASSGDFVKAMIAGEGDIGIGSPAYVLRIKAGGGEEHGSYMSPDWSVGWAESHMLVANSAHRDAALAWINYFGSAESQALIAEKTFYSNGNEAAVKLLRDQGKGDLVDAAGLANFDAMEKMIMLDAPEDGDAWLALWNEFKTA